MLVVVQGPGHAPLPPLIRKHKSPLLTLTLPSPRQWHRPTATLSKRDTFAPAESFDYVQVRMMMFAISDWDVFFARCAKCLRSGGYLEVLSASHPHRAGNPSATPENSAFVRSSNLLVDAWNRGGIDSQANLGHAQRLRGQGFVKISEENIVWPIGEWKRSNDRERRLGKLMAQNYVDFVGRSGAKTLLRIPGLKEPAAQEIINAGIRDAEANSEDGQYHVHL